METRRFSSLGSEDGRVRSKARDVIRLEWGVRWAGIGGVVRSVVVMWRDGEVWMSALRRSWPMKPAPPVMRMWLSSAMMEVVSAEFECSLR